MSKQNISVIILGEIHRDPVPNQVLGLLVKKFKDQDMEIVFAEEDCSDQTLESKLQGNKDFQRNNQVFLKIPAIQTLVQSDKKLNYPYFKLDDVEQIKQIIQFNFPQVPAPMNGQAAFGLMKNWSFSESIKFTQLLLKHKIAYQALEFDEKERAKLIHPSNRVYLQYEQQRINTMVTNLFQKAFAKIEKNGVILLSCGVNHAHRLAVNILLRYAKDDSLKARFNLQVFPIKVFSPYVLDGMQPHLQCEGESKLSDSPEVLAMYPKVACPLVTCDEKEVQGQLTIPELERIFKLVVKDCQKPDVMIRHYDSSSLLFSENKGKTNNPYLPMVKEIVKKIKEQEQPQCEFS